MRAVKWIAITIGILLLVVVVGGVAVIGILGGDTKVSLGKELRSHYRAHVVKMAKLPPGETIEMFYSSDLLLPDNDGNLLTNVAVYSWGDHLGNGQITLKRAAFAEITAVDIMPGESWIDDSLITISTQDDDFFLLLPIEAKRDQLFVEKIRARIPKPTVPGAVEDER
jgi:hypothetical protein